MEKWGWDLTRLTLGKRNGVWVTVYFSTYRPFGKDCPLPNGGNCVDIIPSRTCNDANQEVYDKHHDSARDKVQGIPNH